MCGNYLAGYCLSEKRAQFNTYLFLGVWSVEAAVFLSRSPPPAPPFLGSRPHQPSSVKWSWGHWFRLTEVSRGIGRNGSTRWTSYSCSSFSSPCFPCKQALWAKMISRSMLRIMESEPEKIILWLKCWLAWMAWHICVQSRYLTVGWTDTPTSLTGQTLKRPFSWEGTIRLIRFLLNKLQSHSNFISVGWLADHLDWSLGCSKILESHNYR